MRSYLALLRVRMLTLLQYGKAAVAGACTQIFWALVFSMIFTAFYRENASASSVPLETILTFNWINQGFWLLIPWNIDKEIERQIKGGSIAYELIRPLNLYWFLFFRSLALRLAPIIIRSVPYFILSGFLLEFTTPGFHFISSGTLIPFLLSICFSIILSSSLTTLIMLSLFWTISGEGIVRVLPNFIILLSGLIIPLPLFPSWMQTFLAIQPMRAILDIPCRIYTGMIPFNETFYYLAFQLAWAAVTVLIGHLVMKRAMCKIQIQGG